MGSAGRPVLCLELSFFVRTNPESSRARCETGREQTGSPWRSSAGNTELLRQSADDITGF